MGVETGCNQCCFVSLTIRCGLAIVARMSYQFEVRARDDTQLSYDKQIHLNYTTRHLSQCRLAEH